MTRIQFATIAALLLVILSAIAAPPLWQRWQDSRPVPTKFEAYGDDLL
jgi:hypothetical protein